MKIKSKKRKACAEEISALMGGGGEMSARSNFGSSHKNSYMCFIPPIVTALYPSEEPSMDPSTEAFTANVRGSFHGDGKWKLPPLPLTLPPLPRTLPLFPRKLPSISQKRPPLPRKLPPLPGKVPHCCSTGTFCFMCGIRGRRRRVPTPCSHPLLLLFGKAGH